MIQIQIPAHTLGAAQPTPYAMSSVVSQIAAIIAAPTTMAGMDQNHSSCIINALNLGDALYLAMAACR